MKKFLDEEQAAAPAPATAGAEGPSGPAPFAVKGDPNDDIRRQEAMDPTGVEEVTEEEQAAYTDLVSRLIACISDSRVPEMEGGESPSDAVIKVMSNSAFSVPQALAEGAVSTMLIITTAAKRADKPYSADVIFHAADELIAGLYILGAAAGIFEGASDYAKGGAGMVTEAAAGPDANKVEVPAGKGNNSFGSSSGAPPAPDAAVPGPEAPNAIAPPVGAQAQTAPEQAMPMEAEADTGGDFTDEEYAMLAEAFMLAVELFGRKLLETGQITKEDQKANQQFWKQQIAKEVETGEVDDSMFQDMDLDSIRNQIMKQGA